MPHSFIPPLLSADEPSAAAVEIPRGKAPFLLLCDHAGKAIPQSLGDLGLPPGRSNATSAGISARCACRAI